MTSSRRDPLSSLWNVLGLGASSARPAPRPQELSDPSEEPSSSAMDRPAMDYPPMDGPSMERPPTTDYFAYGSNLSLVQMAERCPASVYRGRARLYGYRWQINERGVANIVPSAPAHCVEGMMFRVDPADERTLDRSEGVSRGFYEKQRLRMQLFELKRPEKTSVLVRKMIENQRLDMRSQKCEVVALVYVSTRFIQDGAIREEYIARMVRAVDEAQSIGAITEQYAKQVIVPALRGPVMVQQPRAKLQGPRDQPPRAIRAEGQERETPDPRGDPPQKRNELPERRPAQSQKVQDSGEGTEVPQSSLTERTERQGESKRSTAHVAGAVDDGPSEVLPDVQVVSDVDTAGETAPRETGADQGTNDRVASDGMPNDDNEDTASKDEKNAEEKGPDDTNLAERASGEDVSAENGHDKTYYDEFSDGVPPSERASNESASNEKTSTGSTSGETSHEAATQERILHHYA